MERLIRDYDNTAPPMRQAVTYKLAVAKHQACGAFLHFLAILQKMSPPSLFEEAKASLEAQFTMGFLDPDLCHILDTQVPPGDIKALGAFRPKM